MRKNLKSFEFIVMVGILIISMEQIVAMSTDAISTLCQLILFAWGILGCVRIDEKNHKNDDKNI